MHACIRRKRDRSGKAAADALGDNIYRPGVCADAVAVSADAGRQETLLARLGRADPAEPG